MATKTTKTTKTATKAKPAVKTTTSKNTSVSVVGLDGKKKGTVTLPAGVFGVKKSTALLAQAVRVYLANQRQGGARIKTRGEVSGSRRKIYRQKGTGRARHGDKYAPIFVGGGVSHGPRERDFTLKMPQKAASKALAMSLSQRQEEKEIVYVDGISTLKPKTKSFVSMLGKVGVETKQGQVQKSALIVTNKYIKEVHLAGRNVEKVQITSASQLTTYDVLKFRIIIMDKDSVDVLKKRIKA